MGYEDLDDEAVRIDAATERVEPEEDIPEVAEKFRWKSWVIWLM